MVMLSSISLHSIRDIVQSTRRAAKIVKNFFPFTTLAPKAKVSNLRVHLAIQVADSHKQWD